MQEHYKKIFKCLSSFHRSQLTVFKECINIMALQLAIMTDTRKTKERKAELKRIAKQYEGKYKGLMVELINLFRAMFKDYINNPGDHLGHIYMQLVPRAANKMGQVFTPYHIAKFMVLLTPNGSLFEEKGVVSYNDPCCGAGAFCIAICDALNDLNINYANKQLFMQMTLILFVSK